MQEINWLSMILATILPMVMGFIWYSKPLFGKAWMDSIGMSEEKQQSANMPVVMGISLVMSFIMAFFMLNFNNGAGQEGVFDTFGHGAAHGGIIGAFLIIPIFIIDGLFEQKSWAGIFINVGYWIITLVLMGGVLDAMNHWSNTAGGM